MKKVSVQFNLMGVAPSGAKMKHGQRRIIPATPANNRGHACGKEVMLAMFKSKLTYSAQRGEEG